LKDENPKIDRSDAGPAPHRIRQAVSLALPIAAALIVLYVWWPRTAKPVAPDLPNPQSEPASQAATPAESSPSSHDLPPGHPGAGDSDSLLQQMSKESGPDNANLSGPVATTAQLESQYSIIADGQEQLNRIRSEVAAAAESKNRAAVQQGVERGKPLMALLNARLAAFQKDLTAARQARPNDPIVQWLTGELFIVVGGEPEDILPYFNRAIAAHLDRPHLFVSLAKVEFDLNHFQEAYRDAAKAIAEAPKSQDAWEIYARAGFAVERFVEVLKNIDLAFPGDTPPWAGVIRRSAAQLQKSWLRELSQRLRDQKKGDLPVVRLVVEHRKFAAPADGSQAASTKVVGRGEVDIELFEDQAPATVNNFVHLVETGFYNGTSFYWAESGHMVVGGDPNTKNADPADDGTGGPGYNIPDEFNLPAARGHFRGTISMAQNGPGRAGSQFFITLVAAPEFDGNSTAFGRVIRGQEVLDQVTEGRTNRDVGEFGKIIPGDLIVRAEVVRKRPHTYVVSKLTPNKLTSPAKR
jgi:cyclophilin family peptidyl-prolyl cis-trans isomerase